MEVKVMTHDVKYLFNKSHMQGHAAISRFLAKVNLSINWTADPRQVRHNVAYAICHFNRYFMPAQGICLIMSTCLGICGLVFLTVVRCIMYTLFL